LSQTTENKQEFVDELRRQAEDSLNRGDVRSARQILDALLQIAPEDADATAKLKQLDATEEAVESIEEVDPAPAAEPDLGVPMAEELGLATGVQQAPPELDFDLDLDLGVEDGTSLEETAAGAASSSTTSQHEIEVADGPSIPVLSVGTTTGDEAPESEVDGEKGALPDPDPQSGEVAILVTRGEEALAAGKVDEAMSLASRAMAISEDAPGAAGLLARAREQQNRRNDEVETAVSTAVSEIESGRPEEAIPLLENALAQMPEHMEAQQYLERARAAASGEPVASSVPEPAPQEFVPLDGSSIDPSELAGGVAASDISVAPSWDSRSLGEMPPPPSTISGVEGTGGAARRATTARPAGGSRGRSLLLIAFFGFVVLGGGWLAYYSFFGGGGDAEGEAAAAVTVDVDRTAAESETSDDAPGAEPERLEEENSGDQPSAGGRREQASVDSRALMTEAQALSSAGRHEEAVAVLERAMQADPTDFDVIDRLEAERQTVQWREQSESRIASARESFDAGSYEEALRLLYRIPDEYKPQDIDRWIANGWYNLGVQAMQMGNTAESIQFFGDCLNLASDDDEAAKHREVALRYRRRAIDDAFKIYVSGLGPREMDAR